MDKGQTFDVPHPCIKGIFNLCNKTNKCTPVSNDPPCDTHLYRVKGVCTNYTKQYTQLYFVLYN